MNKDKSAMQIFQGAIYQYVNGMARGLDINYWHPGYAWACTRYAYDMMGGIFDKGVLGSSDDHMMKAWLGESAWITSVHGQCSQDYKDCVEAFTFGCLRIKVGYTQGVIKHYYHGSKKNRKYRERWDILIKHCYSPNKHLIKNVHGILVPTKECPQGLLEDIMSYFKERNEDE